ncbi:type VII secretion protein EssC [Streptococcus pluranimalium]
MKVIIYDTLYRYSLYLEDGQSTRIDRETKNGLSFECLESEFILKAEAGKLYYSYLEQSGLIEQGQEIEGLSFFLNTGKATILSPLDRQLLLVGHQKGSDIFLADSPASFQLERKGDSWQLHAISGQLYLDNHIWHGHQEDFDFGTEISFNQITLKVFPDEFYLWGQEELQTELIAKASSDYDFYDNYPDFHRSPRIIYRASEEKVTVNAPGNEPNKPKDGLVKLILPPIIMISVMTLITIFQPRGLYIIATMAMSLVTITFSITGYFKNRKQYKLDLEERINTYHLYLSDKSKELTALDNRERKGQFYHYPDLETIAALTKTFDHRIYEKTPQQFDFLYYRLGLGEVETSHKLTYSKTERSGVKDPLEVEGYQLYRRHLTLKQMPIEANLSHGPVGYLGPRPLVIEQLQLMVHQLAVFHSYHDVQFITIMLEEEKEQWDWMRWLPHATLQEMNVRGFVYNQRTRDQVLNSLNQILKSRQNAAKETEGRETTLFTPHYVVIVTDESLIMDHVIMDFFTEDPTSLGCSLVFVQDVLSSLSENVKTIVSINDRNQGQFLMEEGTLKETPFALDHFPEDFDKESVSRRLAPLNHLQNLKSSIPESVTFMEMYEAERFEDLAVPSRWSQNSPYKSLAVPLGLRGQGDIVSLNLHEKAHGPHGLVAGTTGSGKSEIIQSYILSLAVNFHPHDVAFLLIDYKGGGMANLFKDLPHLLGTITNLDGAQSMRALVSINAELKRRQRLFSAANVNHINQYQKKYQLGEVSEPMPHLFLISDEFAELKANQPEFMTELVSTARIGRSLGIHLILATQKPTGVVNDQIWSNSRFKLALKVADRQDSMEMLRTPDAADITQAGRAYLQVGNNEVYELFQSAYSGADYQPEKEAQGIEDHTIYAINALGQYEILNEDLSGLAEADDIRQVPSELDAVVSGIQALVSEMGIKALPQPWLPPLEKVIPVESLRPGHFKDFWANGLRPLEAMIGFVDIPSRQTQEAVSHRFETDGHLVIYSAPGMGKSSLLQTMVMDLSRQLTPEHLHVYLFDFGTNGLLPLRDLPHVADNFLLDDTEKLTKVMTRFKAEMADRKKRFSRHAVSNITFYRQVSGETLPDILIVIDNFDGIKEMPQGQDLENLFQTISREGGSLGMHLVLTAGRQSVIRPGLQTNLKTRIVLKMTDDSEARTLIGRNQHIMEDLPGRGLLRMEEPEVFQAALPTQSDDPVSQVTAIKAEATAMSEAYEGPLPKPIPIVPEELAFEDYLARDSVQEGLAKGELPIGLDMTNVEHIGIPLASFKHLLYLSDNDDNQRNLHRHLLSVITRVVPHIKTMLIDSEKEYLDYQSVSDSYITDPTVLNGFGEQLVDELKDRIANPKEDRKPWLVVIPNLQAFLAATSISADHWAYLFTNGYKGRLHFIIGSYYQHIGITSDIIPKKIRTEVQYTLLGMRLMDQNFLDKVYNSKEPRLESDEAYLHDRRTSIKLKVTSKGETR